MPHDRISAHPWDVPPRHAARQQGLCPTLCLWPGSHKPRDGLVNLIVAFAKQAHPWEGLYDSTLFLARSSYQCLVLHSSSILLPETTFYTTATDDSIRSEAVEEKGWQLVPFRWKSHHLLLADQ